MALALVTQAQQTLAEEEAEAVIQLVKMVIQGGREAPVLSLSVTNSNRLEGPKYYETIR